MLLGAPARPHERQAAGLKRPGSAQRAVQLLQAARTEATAAEPAQISQARLQQNAELAQQMRGELILAPLTKCALLVHAVQCLQPSSTSASLLRVGLQARDQSLAWSAYA